MLTVFSKFTDKRRSLGFSLVELLVVMAIIVILAGLIIGAASAVFEKGKRSRAASEIQAMSTALESYKTDNGIYPPASTIKGPPTVAYSVSDADPSSGTDYVTSSQTLFQALSGGQTSYAAGPTAGTKVYMTFKLNQIGNPTTGLSYIQDPWQFSYGYSTGDTSTPQTKYPNNGSGFFDLWSTAGRRSASAGDVAAWMTNWQ